MKLWVRSQDKKRLIPNPNLYVVESEAGITYIGDTMVGHIGEYATKERALEVLDEIHRLITDLQYMDFAIKNNKFMSYRPNVYEMPKE